MAQQINTNQLHQMAQISMAQIPMAQIQGLTILNNQQHLGQYQQGGQGMYYVQQVPAGHNQVQLQNVQYQHQFNYNHMQPQQMQQQQIQFLEPQQINNHQLNNHAQLQQSPQIQQQQTQQVHQAQQQQQTNNNNNASNNKNNKETTGTKQSGKKKKANKTNKDGVQQPKRATTAYINFTQYYRGSLKKAGRSVPKIGEFGKECAAKWHSMTEEEKKPFTDEAERDRERYRKEMEVFKPARDVNKPKRPGTAFMLFMVDFRKEIAGKQPEGGVAALAKLGGERWRNMTDEEKKPYVEKQNECKITYEAMMEDYRKLTGQTSKDKKENDSDTSEHLNNSLSNSNISNNNGNSIDHQLIKQDHQNHNNSLSPGSTSSPHNQYTMSPSDPLHSSVQQSIAAPLSLQQQQSYYQTNSFISTNFLDQQQDQSYSQTIEQQLHDGQHNQEHSEQQYLQNGTYYY